MKLNIFLVFLIASLVLFSTNGLSYELKVVSQPEIVFDYHHDACDAMDIPDTHARAFRDDTDHIQLIASHHINRRMIGVDFNHLKRDCNIIYQSVLDAQPGHFQDYEWLISTYTFDGNTIYALIHDEFHAKEYGLCTSENNVDCWYNGITSAISRDSGKSYHHLRQAPKHLVAAIPYKYTLNNGPSGMFAASNIIDGHDGYYYFLTKMRYKPDHLMGICVFRTAHLNNPHSWRAWDGKGFNIKCVNPYQNKDNPRMHLPAIISVNELADMDIGNITFNTVANQYLMVGTVHAINSATNKMVYAVAFSMSKDLVHWSNRQYIMDAPQGGAYKTSGELPIGYPSFIDPDSLSRNFETTGRQFDMYYTRFNYDRKPFNPMDRDLLKVKLRLEGKT